MGKLIWGAFVAFVVIGAIVEVSTVEFGIAFVIVILHLMSVVIGNFGLYGKFTLSKMFNLDESLKRYSLFKWWRTHEKAVELRTFLLIVGILMVGIIILLLLGSTPTEIFHLIFTEGYLQRP